MLANILPSDREIYLSKRGFRDEFALALESFSDRYFFEISVLCDLGLKGGKIAELDMPAIYGDEKKFALDLESYDRVPF